MSLGSWNKKGKDGRQNEGSLDEGARQHHGLVVFAERWNLVVDSH
jgi:hypothetical protein